MSTNQNTIYHRSNFITTFNSGNQTYMDFFGSSYLQKFYFYVKNFQTYVVTQRDTLDNLSYLFYGNTSCWWMIALFNNIIHPRQLIPGQNLKIPFKEEIDAFIINYKSAAQGVTSNLTLLV